MPAIKLRIAGSHLLLPTTSFLSNSLKNLETKEILQSNRLKLLQTIYSFSYSRVSESHACNFNQRNLNPSSKFTQFRLTKDSAGKNKNSDGTLTLDQKQFERWTRHLYRGFQPEDLARVLRRVRDVSTAYEIFRWASQQRRFKHNHITYQIMMQKFAYAKMLDQVEVLLQEVIDGACEGTVSFFNSAIDIYVRACRHIKAVNVYRYMRSSSACKPSLETYNLLLSAMARKGTNSYISFMYLQNMKDLFKQMLASKVVPDLFTLNMMIRGYSQSLLLDDTLRIFHKLSFYNCSPNAHTYNYIIRGFCLQNRSPGAVDFYRDMMDRGYVPSSLVFNSLVNCLSLNGELDKGTEIFREMLERKKVPDLITYETLLDGLCRVGKVHCAREILREFSAKDPGLDGPSYRKLLDSLQP